MTRPVYLVDDRGRRRPETFGSILEAEEFARVKVLSIKWRPTDSPPPLPEEIWDASRPKRLSRQKAVLTWLRQQDRWVHSGMHPGLPSGRIYGALLRLEKMGIVERYRGTGEDKHVWWRLKEGGR